MRNPLLEPFDLAPFSKLKTAHFKPAFEAALDKARVEIDAITSNPEPPTFENTIAALDYAGYELERIASIFFNLNSAETNSEIQNLAQEISPMLAAFANDITLNEPLFKRVQRVYETTDNTGLSEEQHMLLTKKYRNFQRNGALLSDSAKEELRAIDKSLSKLKLTFGEHVLAETQNSNYTLPIRQIFRGSRSPPGREPDRWRRLKV